MNRTRRGKARASLQAKLVALLALGITLLVGCGGGSANGADGAGEPRDKDALHDRYAALANEVDEGARDVQRRMGVIAGVDERGPGEQLGEALGPSEREIREDSFACSLGGVSCEVADLEGLLENDIEDFRDEDEYSPNNCDIVTDREYYEGYELDATEDGARYVQVRDDLTSASDGLSEDAEELVASAREMEAAERAYEEASGFEGAQGSWSASEVEALSEAAKASGSEAGDVLDAAGERWSGYEARVGQTRREALALHDEQGC